MVEIALGATHAYLGEDIPPIGGAIARIWFHVTTEHLARTARTKLTRKLFSSEYNVPFTIDVCETKQYSRNRSHSLHCYALTITLDLNSLELDLSKNTIRSHIHNVLVSPLEKFIISELDLGPRIIAMR